MRRLTLSLLLLLAIAGCGGEAGPTPLSPSLRAAFAPRGLADTIEVDAVDRLALRSAELVAPDGTTTPSGPIDANRSERFSAGQFVANDSWRAGIAGSSGASVLAADPQTAATLRAQSEILTTFSHASIPLPDATEYRRNWRDYRIRLTFAAVAGQTDIREIPAPEPLTAR